jgi:uncharacterized glyoxalase superfamily protein PhnB
LCVDDVDAAFARASAGGATITLPVSDTPWGDRHGILRDPFGHEWSIVTHSARFRAPGRRTAVATRRSG